MFRKTHFQISGVVKGVQGLLTTTIGLDNFVRTLSVADQASFYTDFTHRTHAGARPQFRLNSQSECRFDAYIWNQFVDHVRYAVDANDMQRRITGLMQGMYVPSPGPVALRWIGGDASIASDVLLGRVDWRSVLVRKWRDLFYPGRNIREGRQLLRDVLNAPDLSSQKTLLGSLPLGNYFFWATFDEDNPTGDPFVALQANHGTNAAQIARCLGVAHSGVPGDKLIVMLYRLPANVRARIPTIANAYAGDDWLPYFRPNCPTAGHGLTMPIPANPRNRHDRFTAFELPEVVHEPISAQEFALPMRAIP